MQAVFCDEVLEFELMEACRQTSSWEELLNTYQPQIVRFFTERANLDKACLLQSLKKEYDFQKRLMDTWGFFAKRLLFPQSSLVRITDSQAPLDDNPPESHLCFSSSGEVSSRSRKIVDKQNPSLGNGSHLPQHSHVIQSARAIKTWNDKCFGSSCEVLIMAEKHKKFQGSARKGGKDHRGQLKAFGLCIKFKETLAEDILQIRKTGLEKKFGGTITIRNDQAFILEMTPNLEQFLSQYNVECAQTIFDPRPEVRCLEQLVARSFDVICDLYNKYKELQVTSESGEGQGFAARANSQESNEMRDLKEQLRAMEKIAFHASHELITYKDDESTTLIKLIRAIERSENIKGFSKLESSLVSWKDEFLRFRSLDGDQLPNDLHAYWKVYNEGIILNFKVKEFIYRHKDVHNHLIGVPMNCIHYLF